MKITTVISLILFILLYGCTNGNSSGEPQIYLIPEGYTGSITVVYNHPKGQPKKYEGKYRVFEIDEKGCCLSQFGPQYGDWIKEKFVLVDRAGNRSEIETNPDFKTYEEDTTGLKRIFHSVSGDFKPEHPDLHFYSFLICKSTQYKQLVKRDRNMMRCLGD